jgi:hypothetical protein
MPEVNSAGCCGCMTRRCAPPGDFAGVSRLNLSVYFARSAVALPFVGEKQIFMLFNHLRILPFRVAALYPR